MNTSVRQGDAAAGSAALLPLLINISAQTHLFGGNALSLQFHSGLTVLLGPNGAGKTHVLRGLKPVLQQMLGNLAGRTGQQRLKCRFLAAGRSSPFERFRALSDNPTIAERAPAAVGHTIYMADRHGFESLVGDMFALQARADLRLKVEARLQALFRRRLRLEWGQQGLVLKFLSGSTEYAANTEASGVLHLVGLLAALHDDEVGALLIDEPEISLHPQLQSFLLEEIKRVSGDPVREVGKKLVVLSTHAPQMLPLRRIEELPNLAFFIDSSTPPLQISPDRGELRRRNLAALIIRLSESHRLAFFATTVLLVEGPSDEIVVSGLAARFDRSLAGAGAQIVPVIGKGEIAESAKLFRLMGKRVLVLADLDALTDDTSLLDIFADNEKARYTAHQAGHADLTAMDRSLRKDFATAVDSHWSDIQGLASSHRYMKDGDVTTDPQRMRRRAVAAAVLSTQEAEFQTLSEGTRWLALRARFEALLNALGSAGCFVQRRGTVEDCYGTVAGPDTTGKPEAAAKEAAQFSDVTKDSLYGRYADIIRAIDAAAPEPPVDENAFLRSHLGGLLGSVFQLLKPGATTDELSQAAAAAHPDAARIFLLENASEDGEGAAALRVSIISPLFMRSSFPAVIRRDQNLHAEIERLLPKTVTEHFKEKTSYAHSAGAPADRNRNDDA